MRWIVKVLIGGTTYLGMDNILVDSIIDGAVLKFDTINEAKMAIDDFIKVHDTQDNDNFYEENKEKFEIVLYDAELQRELEKGRFVLEDDVIIDRDGDAHTGSELRSNEKIVQLLNEMDRQIKTLLYIRNAILSIKGRLKRKRAKTLEKELEKEVNKTKQT